MTAEIEEPVVDSNGRDAKLRAPNLGNAALRFSTWLHKYSGQARTGMIRNCSSLTRTSVCTTHPCLQTCRKIIDHNQNAAPCIHGEQTEKRIVALVRKYGGRHTAHLCFGRIVPCVHVDAEPLLPTFEIEGVQYGV